MKLTALSTNTQEYRRLRELSIAKSKIQWETIGENDYKATIGDYLFHCEQMDRNNWWIGVYHDKEEIVNQTGYNTESEAKEACIEAYVTHLLS